MKETIETNFWKLCCKLILAMALIGLFLGWAAGAFAAHDGPKEWSLRGLASWSQPLTASGSSLPGIASFTVGDFFLKWEEATTTTELYRLSSGTATITWNIVGGASGGGAPPAGVSTDTLVAYIATETSDRIAGDAAIATVAQDLSSHVASSTDPHGDHLSAGDIRIGGGAGGGSGHIDGRFFDPLAIASQGAVVVASATGGFDYAVVLAPTSSTSVIGVYLEDAGPTEYAEPRCWIVTHGIAMVNMQTGSTASQGAWLITSDTEPGTVKEASSVFLPTASEIDRRVGISLQDSTGPQVMIFVR
jgi:hypothetical protein